MNISRYLTRRLLPNFTTGHTQYVQCVKRSFVDGCHWLDAGGGRRIFHGPEDCEEQFVARAARVVICDADMDSLKEHCSVENRICCNLSSIPLPSESFDFITCGMVVEHLDQPQPCINELGRLLMPGGKLIIHTVNYHSYPTLLAVLSKCLPFRTRIISWITGRKVEDIFPTRYRCNTSTSMTRYMRNAGLQIAELRHIDAGVIFRGIWPLALLECLYIRATRCRSLATLRGQLLVIATKPTS